MSKENRFNFFSPVTAVTKIDVEPQAFSTFSRKILNVFDSTQCTLLIFFCMWPMRFFRVTSSRSSFEDFDVEEMLLSTTTKSSALLLRNMLKRSTKSRTKAKKSSSKNIFPSSLNTLVGGEDSGFSSSGANYIGSLRNYKTALTRSHRNSTEIDDKLNNVRDCATLQGSTISNKTRQSQIMTEKFNDDNCPTKLLKFPF